MSNWRKYLTAPEKALVAEYEAAKARYEELHPQRLRAKSRAYQEMRYAEKKKQIKRK